MLSINVIGGIAMLALEGYYDGKVIQTIQRIQARKNQKLIITILDEFVEEASVGRELNLEQFIMPATERGQDADNYVRELRDNDRF